ncbi:MAG: hypothetical protein PHP45_05920 [Elusimicrobiales bacterium]|nr:hypothetical protein [Elusimicrobiales bacterium]
MNNLTEAGKILWETVTGTASDLGVSGMKIVNAPGQIVGGIADMGSALKSGIIETAKAAPAAVQDISSGASKGLQFGLIFALAIAAYYVFKR